MDKYPAIAMLVRRATQPCTAEDLTRQLRRMFPSYGRPEGRVRQFFCEVRNRKRERKEPYGEDIIGIGPTDEIGCSTALWVRGRAIPPGWESRFSSVPTSTGKPFASNGERYQATSVPAAPSILKDHVQPTPPLAPSRTRPSVAQAVLPGASGLGGRITFDSEATRSRIARLDAYLRREVLDRTRFLCGHEAACRASVSGCLFHPGQMSHVGTRYDAVVDGVPLRVAVIGMSYGTTDEYVSLDARREIVLGVARPGRSLNPHMRGTILALRAAFGLSTDDFNIANEYLGPPEPEYHLFNAFALVNCILCSARKAGDGKKDYGSHGMRTNCRRHLIETVRILQPNLVIVQGGPPASVLADLIRLDDKHIGTLRADGIEAVTCVFTHPSAWGVDSWSSPKSTYLKHVVLPNIAAARQMLGAAS